MNKLEKFMTKNKPKNKSSVLDIYKDEINTLFQNKYTVKQIYQYLADTYDIKVSERSLYYFIEKKTKKQDVAIQEDTKVDKSSTKDTKPDLNNVFSKFL